MVAQGSEVDGTVTKWFSVKKKGVERELEVSVVVEFFRFLVYLWFFIIVIVGMSLTHGITAKQMEAAGKNETYGDVIEKLFGSVNVCAFFDFPPSTYILPTMYAILLLLLYQYAIVSVFRAWIALLEDKIARYKFILYCGAFVYFAISAAIFSTIFAVQPNPKDVTSILVHTLPFTNLIIAICVLQSAVTWFGRNVAWRGLQHRWCTTRWWHFCRYMCLALLIFFSIFKVSHHIIAIANIVSSSQHTLGQKTGNGVLFDVHDPDVKPYLEVLDKLWLFAALVAPAMQSGYFTFKNFHTHLVIVTFRDNRRANTAAVAEEDAMNEQELNPLSNGV